MKKLYFFASLVAILSIVFSTGCKESNTNNTPPPPKVVLAPKSPDSAAVETGIDAEDPVNVPADPNKNGILIQWYPVSHEGLRAYDVYRRAFDTSGNFQKVGEVIQPFGAKDTVFIDTGAGLDTIYYYYVIARDEDGGESEPSEIDHYTLLPKPSLNAPTGGQDFAGSFDWNFSSDFVAQYFIFRLETGAGNQYFPYHTGLYETTGNVQPRQVWSLADFGLVSLPVGQYRWRIDTRDFNDTRTGSESPWEVFLVQ